MEIKVIIKDFLKALQTAAITVKENKIRKVVSGIKITTNKNTNSISIISTDLERELILDLPATIINEGTVVVEHKLLINYLKTIKDEEIIIKTTNTNLKAVTVSSGSEFKTLNSEEFPIIKKLNYTKSVVLKKVEFFSMLEDFTRCISSYKDKKYSSTAEIRLEAKDNQIKVIAADIFKILYCNTTTDTKTDFSITILNETVEKLLKIGKTIKTDTIKIITNNEQVGFFIGNIYFKSRLI